MHIVHNKEFVENQMMYVYLKHTDADVRHMVRCVSRSMEGAIRSSEISILARLVSDYIRRCN